MTAAPLSPIELRRIAEALHDGDVLALRRLLLPPTRYAQRDVAIFEIRCRRFGNLTDHNAAIEIEAGLHAYMTRRSWPRGDRDAETCPLRIANTVDGDYWRVLKLVDRPLKASRIREIVANLKAATLPGDE